MNRQFLAIDIGGTSAKCARITEDAQIVFRAQFETGIAVSKEQFLNSFFRTVDDAVVCGVVGVGICSLGIVDSRTGVIVGGVENMPYLAGLNLRELIMKRYPGLRVHISNDVKAVARGERWVGAARGCRNFACFALGTGLGGAVVIDGRLVEGAHFRAGEVCYTDYRGENDYLEKYTSTKYVMEQAAGELGIDQIDGFEFFRLVRVGDATCLSILDRWVERIARFVANSIVLLDLEKVIIGGGVSREEDILIPRLTVAVNGMLPPDFRGQTEISAAGFAGDAGILGAVATLVNAENNGV